MIIALAWLSLTAAGQVDQAVTPATSAVIYSDQFTNAVSQICPSALRTAGKSFDDTTTLDKHGFKITQTSEVLSKFSGHRKASSDLIDITYFPKSIVSPVTGCLIGFSESNVFSKDRFVVEWKKLAIQLHPEFDDSKIYKMESWTPGFVTITGRRNKPLYKISIGYYPGRENLSDVYSLIIFPISQ